MRPLNFVQVPIQEKFWQGEVMTCPRLEPLSALRDQKRTHQYLTIDSEQSNFFSFHRTDHNIQQCDIELTYPTYCSNML